MTKRKYALRYNLIPETREEGYFKEDAGECGLTDDLIFISILNNEDGSYSQQMHSLSGKTKEGLSHGDLFKAWSIMGMSLHEGGQLTGLQKTIIDIHASTMRDLIQLMKDYETQRIKNE